MNQLQHPALKTFNGRWQDVMPGEAGETIDGLLVLRVNPDCELAADFHSKFERENLGVIIWTDVYDNVGNGDARPGSLIVVGPQTPIRCVVWHGERTPA